MNGVERAELRELSAEVRALGNELRSELRGIQSVTDRLATNFSTIEQKLNDHEHRIRSTEKWKYSIPVGVFFGIATVIGALIGGN